MTNKPERETIKHVWGGKGSLYTIFVLPVGDHWVYLVTSTDMSPRTHSHIGRWLHQPRQVQTAEEAWEQAEALLAEHQKGQGYGNTV
jgi:hypothetical protein